MGVNEKIVTLRLLLSEQQIRYGGYGGIGYYHIAGTYIALFANLIACGAWEGDYIFDFFERYRPLRSRRRCIPIPKVRPNRFLAWPIC
jgi:Tn3 transposase DDE domain